MITLIGTGHVFNLSQPLLTIFDEKQPNIICVELDKDRYNALILKQTDPEAYKKMEKNVPILYRILARFQQGMAEEYGVTPGDEMLTSINYAHNHQIPVAFIDMNAKRLFNRMIKTMTFSEKFKLLFTGFGGFFISKKRVESELKKIEDNFELYISEIGKKFPTIKRVLIDERNLFMVTQLAAANEQHEKVIGVIGDGHVPGVSRLLKNKNIEFETIRLSQLRNQEPAASDSSTATFSMEYKTQ